MWLFTSLDLGEITVLPLVVLELEQCTLPGPGRPLFSCLPSAPNLPLVFLEPFIQTHSFLYFPCYLLYVVPLSSVLEGDLPGDVDVHHIWGQRR